MCVASLFLGAMAGDAFASGVRRFGQSRSVVKFNEEHADMILARDTALHEAARLGGELASAQERISSVAGEMHHELDKCVSERDAALRQADSFQKDLESAQQERDSTATAVLHERDELIGARDAALSESARLSEELRAVSGPNFSEECEELQVARVSVLEKVARLEAECSHAGAELDTLRHRTSSSQGEVAVELLELVAARDAALTETVRLKGELEATISANTCILDSLLCERDELVSARDEAALKELGAMSTVSWRSLGEKEVRSAYLLDGGESADQ